MAVKGESEDLAGNEGGENAKSVAIEEDEATADARRGGGEEEGGSVRHTTQLSGRLCRNEKRTKTAVAIFLPHPSVQCVPHTQRMNSHIVEHEAICC